MDSIFKPAFILMSGRAVGFAAAFIVPVVLARLFDLSEFGTYKQLFLIYATLYGIAQLGMAESLFYFLPANPAAGGRYALNAMFVLALAGGICLIVLGGGQAVVATWFNNEALAGHLPFIGLFLLFMLVSAVLEIVMTARKQHGFASITYATSDLLRAALLIVPVLWTGRLEWVLYGAIIFAALRVAMTCMFLYREYDGNLMPDAGLARAQLAYAAPFSIYVLIEVLQTNLHLYVVSFHFDAATFAIYTIGCLSIPLVDFLMSSAGNVMMVRMREHLLNGAKQAMLAIWRDTTLKLALMFTPLVVGLVVVAHELIVVLFTDNYARSVPIFMVWVLSLLFTALLTDGVLRVYAQIRFLMLLGLIKLALLALTINWFLATFDLVGAVLVVLLTTVTSKVLALARIKSVMQCSLGQFLPWKELAGTLLIAAVAALPALMLKPVLLMPPFPVLLVTGLLYVCVYLGLLWHFGPLDAAAKLAVIDRLHRPVLALFYGRRA
jgi:O-antigen/teichoic acid export membrane protein